MNLGLKSEMFRSQSNERNELQVFMMKRIALTLHSNCEETVAWLLHPVQCAVASCPVIVLETIAQENDNNTNGNLTSANSIRKRYKWSISRMYNDIIKLIEDEGIFTSILCF